jgi:hypothetical protein
VAVFEIIRSILNCLTLKLMALHSLEMSGTTHTTTRLDVAEDFNLQQLRGEDVRFRMTGTEITAV